MADERLRYEPVHDDGKPYVVAILTTPHGLAGGNELKAHGRTHREAAEAMVSLLADLWELQWEGAFDGSP